MGEILKFQPFQSVFTSSVWMGRAAFCGSNFAAYTTITTSVSSSNGPSSALTSTAGLRLAPASAPFWGPSTGLTYHARFGKWASAVDFYDSDMATKVSAVSALSFESSLCNGSTC